MKLVTYTHQGMSGFGAMLHDGALVDLAQAYAALRESSDSSRSLPAVDFPTEILAFLQGGDVLWEVAEATVDWVRSSAARSTAESFMLSAAEVGLLPPISNPSKIVCVGLNYYDHCREQNLDTPESPVLFAKFPSALIGPGDSITWLPGTSEQVDYEAELAFVVKRVARNISADEADRYIAGYTILNDVTARDAQFGDGQWVRGKSFDTFCPIGPYLVTPDEVGDPHRLAVQCWLNGELMQDSSTSEMIFKVPDLLAFISESCTLLPGDIVSTGTPDGVGVFRKPPVFLESGDVVEIAIEKLGRLRNSVR